MFTHNDKLIWQITHLSHSSSFEILVNNEFVAEMLNTKLSQEKIRNLNRTGEEISKNLKYSSRSPYIFYKDTAFLTQINLDAGRGTWLSADMPCGILPNLSENKPMKYHTHNIDHTSDNFALISLFDNYIWYSDILKDNS